MIGNRARTLLLVCGLSLITACTQSATQQSPKPSVPSPISKAAIPPVDEQLAGITGPVCDVSAATVDLGFGSPARDHAYSFSRLAAGKCQNLRAFVGLAADGGPVRVVSSRAAICHPRCRIIATPDVNNDGVPDVAVGQGGYVAFFSLFVVNKDQPAVSLLRKARREVEFAVGGSDQSMWGLICSKGPTLTWWGAGATSEGSGPYSVRVVRYRLRGSELIHVWAHNSLVAQGDPSRLPQDGGNAFGASRGVCGSSLLPSQ